MSTRYRTYVTVSPGLEDVLEAELKQLLPNTPEWRPNRGGIEAWIGPEDLWTIAHFSRVAEGLRVRFGRFKAHDFRELMAGLQKAPLDAYVPPTSKVKIQVTARKSKLLHTGAIEERVEKVLAGRRKQKKGKPGEKRPFARLFVRLFRDQVTLSADAAGELLHRRGYRTHVGRAPLRETLAAACLHLADLQGKPALWDPFCGSGTFLVEALDASRPTRLIQKRTFAFESWPTHDADAYAAWKTQQVAAVKPAMRVFGSEIEAKESDAARTNIDAAGVSDHCELLSGDFKTHLDAIPQGTCIITNAPYGQRLKNDQSWARDLGQALRERPDLRPAWVLSASTQLPSLTGQPFEEVRVFQNGGITVRLWRL